MVASVSRQYPEEGCIRHTQGAQRKARTIPPPRIRAIMAKMVHVVEVDVTRVETSLFVAGNSATSSVLRPNLFALEIKNLKRREAFSQDILDVLLRPYVST